MIELKLYNVVLVCIIILIRNIRGLLLIIISELLDTIFRFIFTSVCMYRPIAQIMDL